MSEALRFSPTEEYQAFRSKRGLSKTRVMDGVATLTGEPEVSRQLIKNPYTKDAKEQFVRRFPFMPETECVVAAVLSEPVGAYDTFLSTLPKDEQTQRQLDRSADITVRLVAFGTDNMSTFWDSEKEDLYDTLSAVAFGSTDVDEIEANYSQRQRRSFRLGIINFIDDLQGIKQYKPFIENDPKGTLSTYARKPTGEEIQLEQDVSVVVTPVGPLFFCETGDYQEIRKNKRSIGHVMRGGTLPQVLSGKVAVIDAGWKFSPYRPGTVKKTKEHEVRHIIFTSFIERAAFGIIDDTELRKAQSLQDHQRYAKELVDGFFNHGQSEIIAYASESRHREALDDLGGDYWQDKLDVVERHLVDRQDLSPKQKTEIYNYYYRTGVTASEQIIFYQWVAQQLFKQTRDQSRSLSYEKAEALLQNVPIHRVGLLAERLGYASEEELRGAYNTEKEKNVTDFTNEIKWRPLAAWEYSHIFTAQAPKEALLGLIETVDKMHNINRIEDVLRAMTQIVKIYRQDLDATQLQAANAAIERVRKQNSGIHVVSDMGELLVFIAGKVDFSESPGR